MLSFPFPVTLIRPFEGVINPVNGTASADSAIALPAGSRKFLSIFNHSSTPGENIHFAFGQSATTNFPYVAPGAEFSLPAHVITAQSVNLIAAAGTPKYSIMWA